MHCFNILGGGEGGGVTRGEIRAFKIRVFVFYLSLKSKLVFYLSFVCEKWKLLL